MEAWDEVAVYLEASRDTGYMRSVDLSTEQLFGLTLSRETCEAIDERCRSLCVEGYYSHVLRDIANVERCQVNSLEDDLFAKPRRRGS